MNEKVKQVVSLSVPAILAELSSTLMQYIDSAMVGSLGAQASAAIGLVASSTWLINGIGIACATGFSVQVAQMIGARSTSEAKSIARFGSGVISILSLFMIVVSIALSKDLPIWLGGEEAVASRSTQYFFVFGASLFFVYNRFYASSVLQCAGNMKTPSLLNMNLCLLDVLFNAFFIFGLGLGVLGAALGTACSEIVTCLMMNQAMRKQFLDVSARSTQPRSDVLKQAFQIGFPIALEHSVLNLAQVFLVKIVSPLGTVSIAANSLAVSAESICYMPGFGIATAATTLVGQSIGAKNSERAQEFAELATKIGIVVMSGMGLFMFVFAPLLFDLLTSDPAVRALGVQVLRIEAFAEPFYAANIVVGGALRGAKDTFVPSLYNLISMWGVRIVLALLLAPIMGLRGVWLAMAIELSVRGCLFLHRLKHKNWKQLTSSSTLFVDRDRE